MRRSEYQTLVGEAGQREPDYETKAQVAQRLAVCERTVDNLMRQRRLPYVRFGNKIVRFPRTEVDAYINRHCRVNARGQEEVVS